MSESQTLTPELQLLLQAVDEVLFYEWDPLGVHKMSVELVLWPRNEYQRYVGPIFSMLTRPDITVADLKAYLSATTTSEIGLRANRRRDEKIAQKLFLLSKQSSHDKWLIG